MRVKNAENPCARSRKYIGTHTYTLNNERTACQINPSARLRERFISLDYNLPQGRAYAERTRTGISLYISYIAYYITQESRNTSGFSLSESSENAAHKEIFPISIVTLLTKPKSEGINCHFTAYRIYCTPFRCRHTL